MSSRTILPNIIAKIYLLLKMTAGVFKSYETNDIPICRAEFLQKHRIVRTLEANTDNHISSLFHSRQYIERYFRSKFGISAYPLFDILMSIEIFESQTVKIESILENFDISGRILERYLAIAEDRQLITIDRIWGRIDLSLTRSGSKALELLAKQLAQIHSEA